MPRTSLPKPRCLLLTPSSSSPFPLPDHASVTRCRRALLLAVGSWPTVESCTCIGPLPRSPCNIRRDGPSTSCLRSPFGDIFVTGFIRSARFTRISALGRVLVYSHTRMLVYSPLGITPLVVTRIFSLGEYSFTRILPCSHTGPRGNSRLLVCSFARLLVCSLTGLLFIDTSPLEVHSFCSLP
jgi:hypothetical protein